jgi:electron transfer flavoprotein beta subunit
MKIIVAIKQVPERDAPIAIASDGKWIDEDDLSFTINEPDAYALEEALQLKEKNGGEVVVLCLGPERVTSTLREALAKGADRAIHVEFDELSGLDTLAVAKMLAEAIRPESAELLGIPHATIIMQVEKTATGLRVKRELEDGWFQHVEMPLPALLTMQSGGNKLRYATLMGIKKAKSKETATVSPGEPAAAAIELARVYLPEKQKKTEMLKGSATEVANQIVEKLKFEVRAL